jgi:hypothetical protein
VCGRKFYELLKVSTLKFEVCGKEVSSCWKLQVLSVSKRVFCHCWKFQVKFQVCARKFSSVWGFSCKGFFLWHIVIEWERFEVRSSNISKFFNLKFPICNSFEYKNIKCLF